MPCLIVWPVTKGDALDKLRGIAQEMLEKIIIPFLSMTGAHPPTYPPILHITLP